MSLYFVVAVVPVAAATLVERGLFGPEARWIGGLVASGHFGRRQPCREYLDRLLDEELPAVVVSSVVGSCG